MWIWMPRSIWFVAFVVPTLSLVTDFDFPTLPNVGVDLMRTPIASLASHLYQPHCQWLALLPIPLSPTGQLTWSPSQIITLRPQQTMFAITRKAQAHLKPKSLQTKIGQGLTLIHLIVSRWHLASQTTYFACLHRIMATGHCQRPFVKTILYGNQYMYLALSGKVVFHLV